MSTQKPLGFDPIDAAGAQWSEKGWSKATLGMSVVTSVMRAHQIYLSHVEEVLKPFGLTFSRYELLMVLAFSRSGSMPLGRIGARLQVHPTSVTNAVNRLEAQGLIERREDEFDRRATLAELLPSGREIALKATAELNREVFEAPGLDAADLQSLYEIIRRLRLDTGDFEDQPPPKTRSNGLPVRRQGNGRAN